MPHRIASPAASHLVSEHKDRLRVRAFEGVSDGVLAPRADALGPRAPAPLRRLSGVHRGKRASRTEEDRLTPPSSTDATETGPRRATHPPDEENRILCRDTPRTDGGSTLGTLRILPASQEAAQIDLTNGILGPPKALIHLHLPADLLGHLGGNIKRPGLAVEEQRDLKLGMQMLAVRTAAMRLSALAAALDEAARKHSPEPAPAASLPRVGSSSSPGRVVPSHRMTLYMMSDKQ